MVRRFYAFQKRTEALIVQIKHHLNEHAGVLRQHAEVLRQHETWMVRLDEQLQALTALVNRVMTPGSLTAEHQGELRAMLRGAAHQAGQPITAIEHELAAAFGVETISQLPEARWGEVAAWFHQRLGW